MAELKKLFEPITVGSMTMKNRITLLPLQQHRLDRQHYYDYAVELAKGGCGLIVITSTVQHEPGEESVRFLREMADAVHQYGAKIAGHAGTGYGLAGDEEASVSEHFISTYVKIKARAATIEEIHQAVREVGEIAQRCYEAGFDAMELHIGMGYTLNRFLSTATNRRTDEYGGSRENRMRIVLECMEAVRSRIPRDFPLICRFTPEEFMPGGLTWNDWKEMVPILDRAGVDIWSVQPGWHDSSTPFIQPSVPPGAWVYLAAELKKVTKTPVITAYRIMDPLLAERILAEGKADLIGMGRALLADPYLPNKAQEGRFDEIRPCLSTCIALEPWLQPEEEVVEGETRIQIDCDVNPRCCLEKETVLKPVTKARKVFVIGGGPAGMQAAMTAAERGHRVTLYERGDKLGGQLLIASLPPYKDEVKRLSEVMAAQVKKAGAKVKLNTEVTSQFILSQKPDAVIIATGAKPFALAIPGSRGDNVVTAIDALVEPAKVGKKVVIIGGGVVGCETAEFLVGKGKEVTVLEMLPRLALNADLPQRWVLRQRLIKAGVALETSVKAEEITREGVRGVREGNPMFFPADTVVLAAGGLPNRELANQVRDKVPEIRLIGDCVQPRKIKQAIAEGYAAGNRV